MQNTLYPEHSRRMTIVSRVMTKHYERDTPCEEMIQSKQKCPEISRYKHTYICTLCSEQVKACPLCTEKWKGHCFTSEPLYLFCRSLCSVSPSLSGAPRVRDSGDTGPSDFHANNTRSDLQKLPRMSTAVGLSVCVEFLQERARKCACSVPGSGDCAFITITHRHTHGHTHTHKETTHTHTNKQHTHTNNKQYTHTTDMCWQDTKEVNLQQVRTVYTVQTACTPCKGCRNSYFQTAPKQ